MDGLRNFRRHIFYGVGQGLDMSRRRSAAAADDMGSGFDEEAAVFGKFFGRRLIDRLLTVKFRKARIGLGDDRDIGVLVHRSYRIDHVGRPCRAVEADGVDA